MKVTAKCLGCDKVIRFHGSFKIRLTERTTSILTGEIKETELVGQLCRPCAKIAGYKVKHDTQEKTT